MMASVMRFEARRDIDLARRWGSKEEIEQGNMASLTGEQHKKAREEEELDSFLVWAKEVI
jgi:hypothetical protein